jgi:tetratricopeptide (TPR) repeat protein
MKKSRIGRAVLHASVLLVSITLFAASTRADDRATCHDQNASAEVAIAACDRLISSRRLKSHDLALEYNRRGFLYEKRSDHDRALADFNQAIRLDSNLAVVYNNLGWVYNNKGEFDRAIPDFDRAIRLNQNLVIAFTNRALAFNGKHDYDRAISDLDQAIRLDPATRLPSPGVDSAFRKKVNTIALSMTSMKQFAWIRVSHSPTTTWVGHTTAKASMIVQSRDWIARSSSIRTLRWPSVIAALRTTARGITTVRFWTSTRQYG